VEFLKKSIDGEPSEEAFKNCAIRHCKDLLELDLTPCKNWWKFLELQYAKKTHKQITIIYLVSIWDCLPSREEFINSWSKREIAKLEKNFQKKILEQNKTNPDTPPVETPIFQVDLSKAPHNTYIYTNAKKEKYINTKTLKISLDGLLDYNINDDTELTFEVSLFAENFNDMLQRDFGTEIYHSLMSYNPSRKRKREEELQVNKKRKLENDKEESNDTGLEIVHNTDNVEDKEKDSYVKVTNEKLLRAFHYFDKNRVGFLKTEDLGNILYCSGLQLSKNIVHELIDKVSSVRKVKYNDICEISINMNS